MQNQAKSGKWISDNQAKIMQNQAKSGKWNFDVQNGGDAKAESLQNISFCLKDSLRNQEGNPKMMENRNPQAKVWQK